VAHACNPTYSRGGNWKDHGSRPTGKKVRGTPPHLNSKPSTYP
jgi:hypothetical protein